MTASLDIPIPLPGGTHNIDAAFTFAACANRISSPPPSSPLRSIALLLSFVVRPWSHPTIIGSGMAVLSRMQWVDRRPVICELAPHLAPIQFLRTTLQWNASNQCLHLIVDKFSNSPRVDCLVGIRTEATEPPETALKYYADILETVSANNVEKAVNELVHARRHHLQSCPPQSPLIFRLLRSAEFAVSRSRVMWQSVVVQ
ncbi:hypothetical protein DEU56DRAFT_913387 [Suillus clintonianus]|uniref:uncharacterized protein n=1 Tax=Suillus clintonianus TaxID=1904413 RepID=UPI001B85B52A|nr:uncharacterized protein DEU56DRAFT_913387 [Suillus clintonianus]KAG2135273.1 hypothetical protein DEU56DRAFT_913387 [Suillus clintonianus]